MKQRKYDLEDWLVDFAVMNLSIISKLPMTIGAKNLAYQLSRSSTSLALNYGEAQSAESDKDFIHKMRLCLKELRESQICLKIIKKIEYLKSEDVLEAMNEVN